MINYLLEKSRVVGQTPGEQNFHVFYQMLNGCSEEEQKAWHVSKDLGSSFPYVGESCAGSDSNNMCTTAAW